MNFDKLVQSVGYILLKYPNKRQNYTKLIKILYLADKESICETAMPITNDTYYSLDNGPILSGLYGLIKGKYHNKGYQQNGTHGL